VSIDSTETRIRPATRFDGEGIGEVHAASWAAAYDHIFEAAWLTRAVDGRRRGWPRALASLPDSPGFILVAECDNRIVGFAHAGPDNQGRPVGEIFAFYTHPDVWGAGAAMSLMTLTCSNLASEFNDVVLWTLRDAGRARHFYEKVGFVATGTEKVEILSDWTTLEDVERPAVEYRKSLAG